MTDQYIPPRSSSKNLDPRANAFNDAELTLSSTLLTVISLQYIAAPSGSKASANCSSSIPA